MHRFIIPAMIGAIGILTGNFLNEREHRWDNVIVVHNGAVVANPDTLTVNELAESQVVSLRARLIGFDCENQKVLVNWDGDAFPTCRKIETVARARKEAI
ncbi:hypothetical protein [Sphingomonas jaspsi]|uniref:hypothetical protein n=1 Tax=Sphingomonas jaspsi TaxID=392409 RepID=UPI0004AD874F|nr:hypothetical protein [Sphingomonas jaspsi]